MEPKDTYAVILAGGSGQRFWPLSRNHKPKQLLELFGETTLLEETVLRLEGVVPPEKVLIVTNALQKPGVLEIAARCGVPEENVVAEPERRDTAPAIAFATGWVAARNPDAVMIVLSSDQRIADHASFRGVISTAVDAAAGDTAIVTIGVKPTWACPGYGYIELGAAIGEPAAGVREVVRFREKPSPDVAEGFLRQGGFVWNAGMFIWSAATARNELAQHCPELALFIDNIVANGDPLAVLASEFGALPKISIDFALMEKAARVLNVEATFDWDDVGSWISVAKYLNKDSGDNLSNVDVTTIESTGNIVFSQDGDPTNISLLGVDDLIVVRTKDALLVADKNKADHIKKLIDLLPENLH